VSLTARAGPPAPRSGRRRPASWYAGSLAEFSRLLAAFVGPLPEPAPVTPARRAELCREYLEEWDLLGKGRAAARLDDDDPEG
jgi:hypothetical protein